MFMVEGIENKKKMHIKNVEMADKTRVHRFDRLRYFRIPTVHCGVFFFIHYWKIRRTGEKNKKIILTIDLTRSYPKKEEYFGSKKSPSLHTAWN